MSIESKVADRWLMNKTAAGGCELYYLIKGFGDEVTVYLRGVSEPALFFKKGLVSMPKSDCIDTDVACEVIRKRANSCFTHTRNFVKHIDTMCRAAWNTSGMCSSINHTVSTNAPVYCGESNAIVYSQELVIGGISDNAAFRKAFKNEARNYDFNAGLKAKSL